jgi:hypothetical protein
MGYITVDEAKASLELTGTVFADLDLAGAVETASSLVDELANRTFTAGTAGEARVFYANMPGLLEIDDAQTVTAVAVDWAGGTAFTDTRTDYVLEPRNAGNHGEPYTRLRFSSGIDGAVQVTGTYGWATVPASVKTLTLLLPERLVKRQREAPFGVVTFGLDGGAVRASQFQNDPEIAALVHDIRRVEIMI